MRCGFHGRQEQVVLHLADDAAELGKVGEDVLVRAEPRTMLRGCCRMCRKRSFAIVLLNF
jgi:hypothetical protein